MSLLVACPVILPPRPSTIDSWTHRDHLIIDNTPAPGSVWRQVADTMEPRCFYIGFDPPGNYGVAYAWNVAFATAKNLGISHVALVSQGLVLDGGTQKLASLVDEYADWRGLLTDFAWHCIVLSVKLWEQVGPFDEDFRPAYYEDQDYVRRLEITGLHTGGNPIPKLARTQLDCLRETTAGALHAGLIDRTVYAENGRRFRNKWGGDPGHETFTRPYDPDSIGDLPDVRPDLNATAD